MRLVILLIAAAAVVAADEPAKKIKLGKGKKDIAAGEILFQNHCALCHGRDGGGGRGPVLAQQKLRRASDDTALVKVIQEGIHGTEMPGAWQLDDRELRQVAAYVRSLSRVAVKAVPGNAEHGAEIYTSQGCAGCHVIKGEGGIMGPELGGIGLRRSLLISARRSSIRKLRFPTISCRFELFLLMARQSPGCGSGKIRLRFRFAITRVACIRTWKRDLKEIVKDRGKSPMPAYKDKLHVTPN